MDLLKFVDKLHGKSPILALEEFLKEIKKENEGKRLILDFLKISPKCDDILHLLKHTQLDSAELATICDTLRHILMSLVEDVTFEDISLHITRWVLQNHNEQLNEILSSEITSPHLVASTLHFITGMVLSSNVAALEVLTHLQIGSMNFSLYAEKRSKKKADIRTPLIFLMLAFLNTKENIVLKKFVQNVDFITCIFKGLPADPSELVVEVLTLLHETVVLNISISKTLKTKLFSYKSCKFLMNLYFHYYPEDAPKYSYSHEEKTKIKVALHKLMITLCSDIKHGIVFRDKNVTYLKYGDKSIKSLNDMFNNKHTFLILNELKHPWEFEEGRELFHRAVSVSSQLPILFMKHVNRYDLINPVPTLNFYSLMHFIIFLLNKHELWRDLEVQISEGPIGHCKLLMAPLNFSIVHKLVGSTEHVVRHVGVKLLLTVCNKAKETIYQINQKTVFSNSQKTELKTAVLKEVERICKVLIKVTSQWSLYLAISDSTLPEWYRKECPTKFSMLMDIAHCFCLCAELFGFSYVKSWIKPLKRIHELLDLSERENKENEISYQNTLKLMMELLRKGQQMNNFESCGFLEHAQNEKDHVGMNETLFIDLIKVYCRYQCDCDDNSNNSVKKDLQNLSLELLNGSLETWGLAMYCENKIEIWLKHMCSGQIENSKFLTKVITKSVNNLFIYVDELIYMDPRYGMQGHNIMQLIESVNYVEFKDNEDIMLKELTIPFSCLIVAAVDVLKENPDPNWVKYFSGVVDDYITFLENPKSLAECLLKNENVLTLETRQYLRAYVFKEFADTVNVSDDSMMSKLRGMFVTRNYPNASDFCSEWLNQTNSDGELVPVCRHLLLYLQSDHKKAKKFSLRVLKNLFSTLNTESDFKIFLDVVEYLISHPFILKSYHPFTSSDAFHTEIERILALAIDKFPALHNPLKPFLEKAITELKSLSTDQVDVWHSLSIYLSKYTLLTYADLERMICPLLSASLPYSESCMHSLNKLLYLLIIHTHASCQPSEELTNLFLSKMISWSQRKVEDFSDKEEGLIILVSTALSASLNLEMIQNIKSEDLKSIFAFKPFNSNLCCRLIRIQPSITRHLPHKLFADVDLPSQAAFIVELLKMAELDKTCIHPFLREVKEDLLNWMQSSITEMNDAYQYIFAYMIQTNMLELSDLRQIYTKLFDNIVNSEQLHLPHFLSIIPIFDHLEAEEDRLHPRIRLLCPLLHVVRMAYKRHDDPKLLGKLAGMIASILEKLDPHDVARELSHNKIWSRFVKQVLKVGLVDPVNGPQLLKLINTFCGMIYSEGKDDGECILPAAVLCQMMRSHSHYIPIMFSQEEHHEIKEQLVFLQLQLVTYHRDVCEERHVPVFLGSYGATRSFSDQGILKLLYLYEDYGFMPTYEPTVWGLFAVTYFAVEEGPGVCQKYRTPSHHQILNLIDDKKVIETALHFDVNLGLEPVVLRGNDRSLYDQRFLMMLFARITSDTLQVRVIELMEKGVLAIAIACLSSHVNDVWALGAKLLGEIVFHFEDSSYRNLKYQWIWLVRVIAGGLQSRKERLPTIMVHFLVKASQLFLTPEDVMYGPVMNYLWLRPELPLFKVPEMYLFLLSDHIKLNQDYQKFILEILAFGIRDELDWDVCDSSYVPKFVMGIMTSASATARIRVLCVNVLKAMVEVPTGAQRLVLQHSLMVELPLVLEPTKFCSSIDACHFIDAVVSVLTSFWRTWKSLRTDVIYTSSLLDHINMPSQSTSKRKFEETYARNSSEALRKAKKRKLSDGEVATKGVKDEEKLNMSDFVIGCVELFVCLERVVPAVLSEGMVTSLSQCFHLLSEILTVNLPKERSGVMQLNSLKQKVKSWIDRSVSLPRFRYPLTDGEDFTEDCKLKPLKRKTVKNEEAKLSENQSDFKVLSHVKNEEAKSSENQSDFKILSQVTGELLTILEGRSPS